MKNEREQQENNNNCTLAKLALIFSIIGGFFGIILGIVGKIKYKSDEQANEYFDVAIAIGSVWIVVIAIVLVFLFK